MLYENFNSTWLQIKVDYISVQQPTGNFLKANDKKFRHNLLNMCLSIASCMLGYRRIITSKLYQIHSAVRTESKTKKRKQNARKKI